MLKSVFLLSTLCIVSLGWSAEETFKFKTLSEIGQPSSIPTVPTEKKPMQEDISSTVYLDKEEIIALIADYIQEKFQADYTIHLEEKLVLPQELAGQAYDLELEDVQINDSRTRLKAKLVFKDTALQLPVTARLQELQEVPVLVRPLKPGEVITEQNITWQKLPEKSLRGKIITSIEEMIGYQPRQRSLAAGEPIRKHDLVKPQTIKRGAMVMVSFDNKGISIQMQAKALDSGAIGESIRVLNVDSNKILKGTIDALGNVTIQAPTIYAATGANHDVQ